MQIVPLHPPQTKDDLVAGLRTIADEIESGECDFDPTLCVVVLADETTRRDPDGEITSFAWQTHALGPKNGYFTAKGVLAAALGSFDTHQD